MLEAIPFLSQRRQDGAEDDGEDSEEGDDADKVAAFHGVTVMEMDFLSWSPNWSLIVSVTV
jgi:hypothetical protein